MLETPHICPCTRDDWYGRSESSAAKAVDKPNKAKATCSGRSYQTNPTKYRHLMHHEIVKDITRIQRGAKFKPGFVQGFRVKEEEICSRPTARRTSWEVNYWSAAVGRLVTLLLQQNNKFHESEVVRRCSKCSNKHKTCTKKLIRVRTLRLTISHHTILQLGTFVEHFQTCVEWRRRRTRAKHQVQQYGSCNIYGTTWVWTTYRMTSQILFIIWKQNPRTEWRSQTLSNLKQ